MKSNLEVTIALFKLDQLFSYQDANEIKKFWAGISEPPDYEEGEIWLDILSIPPLLKRCNGKNTQGNYMWDIIGEVTPSSMLTKIKTVDGSGSGLDADLLDGNEGSYYLNPVNLSTAVPKDKLPSEALLTDTTKDVSADIEWQDNCKAKFGNDGDLKVYHSGTQSYIDNSTGYLALRNLKAGENIYFQATPTSGSLKSFLTITPDTNGARIEGMFNFGDPDSGSLAIANGSITVTKSFHKIDTEGAAATDELTTINGGCIGDMLILMSASSSRDITLKNDIGNLKIGSDILLDHIRDKVILIALDNHGTLEWNTLGFQSNG